MSDCNHTRQASALRGDECTECLRERVAQSELAPAPGSVFEAVDATSEESYYTMGIWPTLDAAVAALRACGTDAPGEHDDDGCVVEIRERKIGKLDWSETGKMRWKFVWEKKYEASDDSYEWHVTETPNTKVSDSRRVNQNRNYATRPTES